MFILMGLHVIFPMANRNGVHFDCIGTVVYTVFQKDIALYNYNPAPYIL